MSSAVPSSQDAVEPQSAPGFDGNGKMKEKRERKFGGFSLNAASLGALPYFLFLVVFLILPILANTLKSFQDPQGNLTLNTMAEAVGPNYRSAFVLTFNLSLFTAVVGGFFGILLAWALTNEQRPKKLSGLINSFSALAAQSGGVGLAYAFIALMGTEGLITVAVSNAWPGFRDVFNLTGFLGVSVVYLYFQIPLMATLMLPAMQGVRKEWYDAASSLGATRSQYIKDVVIPVLWPAILGALLLLFANAFAAYATAFALAGGSLNLVPILIGFFISGNVLLNPGLAAALVTWMMLIIIGAMALRIYFTKRSEKWLNQ